MVRPVATAVGRGELLSAAAALCAEGAAGATCGEGHGGEASGAADAGLSVHHSVQLSGGTRWEKPWENWKEIDEDQGKSFFRMQCILRNCTRNPRNTVGI